MDKDDYKVGQDVMYFASKTSKPVFGVIYKLGDYCMVQYDGDEHAIATYYEDLLPLLVNEERKIN